MRARISKWGNSLAVRLPRAVVAEAGLADGQSVELMARNGAIEMRPVTAVRFTLDELVAEMKLLGAAEEPPTVEWGPDVGSEVIADESPALPPTGGTGRLPRASRRR